MRRTPESESGYLLIAVLFLMALLLFALATAVPRVRSDLRRDREAETVHRGMQYARAIRLYYRKFGHYPVSIDELLNTNHMRFLRRKYVDPMTGKDAWRLIHVGEAKTMTLGGVPGQVGIPAGQAGQSGPGGITPIGSLQGGGTGTINGGSGLQGGQTPGGIVATAGQQTAGPNAPGTPSDSQPGSATPGSNVGGGPIVGVSSTNPGASIKILKKMQKYNQWEFIYDPTLDVGGAGGANGLQGTPTGGQPNTVGTPVGDTPAQPVPTPTPTPTPNPQ